MADRVASNDEAFAQQLLKIGLVSDAQIRSALQAQSESALKGDAVSLAEILVRQGLLSPAQRESLEKKFEATKHLGPYRILRKIGEGGMGAVYLAEDPSTRQKVALKVLPKVAARDEDTVHRFMREVESAQKLDHANIVRASGGGEDRGFHYYVMEFVEGETLGGRLKREEALSPDEATKMVLQVAHALKYAHDLGYIHRDIKPDNVIVSREGVAKVLDMGLSKNIDEAQTFRTVTGVALGTPHYISPEQARGDKGIDGRADLYSLGATYYHLVAGETPFQGTTAVELIAQHLNKQLPDPRDLRDGIPDGVVHVIRRMMAKKPKDRYAGAAELINDLELVLRGTSPASQALAAEHSSVALPMQKEARERYRAERQKARKGTVRVPHAKPPSRAPMVAAGAMIAAGLALVIVLMLSGRSKPPSAPVGVAPKAGTPLPEMPQPRLPERTPLRTLTPEERREEEAARKLGEIQEADKGGRFAPDEIRRRYVEFARAYADTPQGRTIADWLLATAPKPAVALPPPPPVKPAIPDPPAEEAYPLAEETWRGAIDLLGLVDPAQDAVSGNWTRLQGALQCDVATGAVRLEIPYVPPDEYDFRIEFTRLGGNSDVVQVLSKAGRPFAWLMAGGANLAFGIEQIGGKRVVGVVDPNPTQVLRPGFLKNGERHVSIVQVRTDGIKAFLDGKLVSRHATDFSDMSIWTSWMLRDNSKLGLAGWASAVAFHSAQLLEITGKGRPTRGPEARSPGARQGNGLLGIYCRYFGNAIDFASPLLTRVDRRIDFPSSSAPPDPRVQAINFWVRWTGQVQARHSEEYTFHAVTDDGVRLWVDETPIIDSWVAQAETERTGRARLVAGRRHSIRMEFYQGQGPWAARLLWSSPSTPKEVIPTSRLYPSAEEPDSAGAVPVPAAAALREAEKGIREIRGAPGTKRAPQERFDLALRMIEEARKSEDDARRYALLVAARDEAAAAGGTAIALTTVGALEEAFELDGPKLRAETLTALAKTLLTAEATGQFAQAWVDLVDSAIAKDDYERAKTLARQAGTAAVAAKLSDLAARVQSRVFWIASLERDYRDLRDAPKKLENSPDDPAACLALGRFLCLSKGDWEKGLPLLAKGPDDPLKAAAEMDLKGSTDALAQAELCKAWIAVAEKERNPARKTRLLDRARLWQWRATPGMVGTARTEIARRMDAVERQAAAQPTTVDLIRLIDPAKDTFAGKSGWSLVKGTTLSSPFNFISGIQIPYAPPDEYDVRLVVERKAQVGGAFMLGLAAGARQFQITFGDAEVFFEIVAAGAPAAPRARLVSLPQNAARSITCSVRRSSLMLSIDGEPILSWDSGYERLSLNPSSGGPARKDALFLLCSNGGFHVSRAVVTPLWGEGVKLR